MYCSHCGAESVQGSQYCKRCGANLIQKPQALVWIVAFGIAMMMGLPMGGIAIVFERTPGLLEKGLPLWFLMALATISLLMVSMATFLLSRLLLPVFKNYLQSGEAKEAKKPALGGDAPLRIDAHPHSVSSVTEATTRTFEPANVERDTHG